MRMRNRSIGGYAAGAVCCLLAATLSLALSPGSPSFVMACVYREGQIEGCSQFGVLIFYIRLYPIDCICVSLNALSTVHQL